MINNKIKIIVILYLKLYIILVVVNIIIKLFIPLYIKIYSISNRKYSFELISRSNTGELYEINEYRYYNSEKNIKFRCGRIEYINFSKNKKYFYGISKNPLQILPIDNVEKIKNDYCPKYFMFDLESGVYIQYNDRNKFNKMLKKNNIKLQIFEKYMYKKGKIIKVEEFIENY